MSLNREEFEDWLEDHRDEALDRIEVVHLPLIRWIALYAKSLGIEARESPESEEEEPDDEPDDLGLDEGEDAPEEED